MDSQFLGSGRDVDPGGGRPGADLWLRDGADGGGAIRGYFELKEGSLYPALHRLERQKLLRSFMAARPRPPAQVLRADRRRPSRAGRAQAVLAELHGRRQRRAGHQPGRSGRL